MPFRRSRADCSDQLRGAAGVSRPTAQHTVFVCLDDDDDALQREPGHGRTRWSAGAAHVVVCMRESSPFAGVLAGSQRIDRRCTGKDQRVRSHRGGMRASEHPRRPFTEQLARVDPCGLRGHGKPLTAGHPRRTRRWFRGKASPRTCARPTSPRPPTSATRWRRSARSSSLSPPARPSSSFTDEEVECLAEQEHERWMRDRLNQGWTYGQTRDNERKIHPDLQPWAALSDGR